jgi:hypothetical protein
MRQYRNNLSVEEVRAALSYDPDTGILYWRSKLLNRRAVTGRPTSRAVNRGYLRVKLNGTYYFAHRIVWFVHTGAWPLDQIDHVNLVRTDNRFVNLREADSTGNMANRAAMVPNQLKGVTHVAYNATNPWQAQIVHKRKHYNLGYYPTEQAAHEAYVKAAKRLFGSYARAE